MLLALVGLGVGCSVGTGEGAARGVVSLPECGLDRVEYDLRPTFFAGEAIDGQLVVRMQRGSDFESMSDGIVILLRDAALLRREHLGESLPLGGPAPLAELTLYLHETCPLDRRTAPADLGSVDGTITFEHVYAPAVDESDVETSARFDARFEDASGAEPRFAELEGSFRFLFTRGRPAQRFP